MVRKLNSFSLKESKGSIYDMIVDLEDRIDELESDYYDESLTEDVSKEDVRELVLYISNDEELYRNIITPVIKNLQKKIKMGIYDDSKALISWLRVADKGVKKYDREFGSGKGSLTLLDKATRMEIAKELKDDFDEEVHENDFVECNLKESDDKRWLNTEVTEDEYKKLKKFLVDNNIKHETSGAYNLIHVEVYVDEYEKKILNDFLSKL